ncbi:MAG: hypothetical protein FWG61_05340 [Firmicutes bacterium]|nr:hypothetical protein [Bacillota bacterium]
MNLQQESAAEDSAAVIESIVSQFQTMNLPRLADQAIYLGMPMSNLENLRQTLNSQRYDDEKRRFASRLKYAGIAKDRVADTFKWGKDIYPLTEPSVIEYALSIEFVKQQKNLTVLWPGCTPGFLFILRLLSLSTYFVSTIQSIVYFPGL